VNGIRDGFQAMQASEWSEGRLPGYAVQFSAYGWWYALRWKECFQDLYGVTG
jgi:hypothetical protein